MAVCAVSIPSTISCVGRAVPVWPSAALTPNRLLPGDAVPQPVSSALCASSAADGQCCRSGQGAIALRVEVVDASAGKDHLARPAQSLRALEIDVIGRPGRADPKDQVGVAQGQSVEHRQAARHRQVLPKVTPFKYPEEIASVTPAVTVTVPFLIVPPARFHDPVVALSVSVVPVLSNVPVTLTVPPVLVNVPRLATVKLYQGSNYN